MEAPKRISPLFNMGYHKAVCDLENLLNVAMSDLAYRRIRFDFKKAREFMRLFKMHFVEIREHDRESKDAPFIRYDVDEKRYKYYNPRLEREKRKWLL